MRIKMATILASLIILSGTTMMSEGRLESGKYSVSAIHAHLYFHSVGETSPTDLLDGKPHGLWNTIIGEGEAGKPSGSVLVLVGLTGPTFANLDGKLTLTASEGEKVLLNQTVLLRFWFSEGQKVVIPFLVYGTGCHELKITAKLEDLSATMVDTRTLTKVIPFECGE